MKRYMMACTAYPDYVLGIELNHELIGPAWKMAIWKGRNAVQSAMLGNTGNPANIFWSVCAPPKAKRTPGAVQMGISFTKTGYIWSYVGYFSARVFGWGQVQWQEPDARGQWIPEPALKLDLDPCPGP
mmetsp:Transcript_51167/g.163803  ORF Transcript_51167/g.163803 Transcript_51167/m.163803 type:complete len:128 (-) Transcript_51167:79-462(-)